MADSTSGNLKLPEFETGKSYILKGETLQQIIDVIKENRVVLTGSKQYDEVGQEGSKLGLDTLELDVCVEGVVQKRKFLIASFSSATSIVP